MESSDSLYNPLPPVIQIEKWESPPYTNAENHEYPSETPGSLPHSAEMLGNHSRVSHL